MWPITRTYDPFPEVTPGVRPARAYDGHMSEMYERVKSGAGFIAALDQSGGSTPKALRLYGIEESAYSGEEEMFDLMHAMRSRICTSPAFTKGATCSAAAVA